MAHNHNNVTKVYKNVIDEVIKNVREPFLNDGVDEQVLQELKQIWESKVSQSRAVEVVEPKKPTFVPVTVTQHQQVHQAGQQVNMARGVQPVTTTAAMASFPLSAPQPRQYTAASGRYIPSNQTQIYLPSGSVTPIQMTISDAAKVTQQQLRPQQQQPRPVYHGMPVPTIQPTRTQQPLPQTLVNQRGTTQQTSSRTSVITCIQVDGPNDSDSEDDEDDDELNAFGNEDNDDIEGEEKTEEDFEPLNSEDDVSDEDSSDLFDTDNVVVCQFDRITRSKNKWKFHLKDGIMNLNGRDYVFQKANGEAEW